MEFTWCGTFTINGRTHANGDIFIGPAGTLTLTFNDLVTATGAIYQTNWDGHTAAAMGRTVFATNNPTGTPGYITNVPPLHLPIGADQSPAAVREIIEMPPPGEDINSYLAQSRYFNKAGVVVLVSNATVMLQIKASATDQPTSIVSPITPLTPTGNGGMWYSAGFSWLRIGATNFTDFRENSKKVKLTQIDVGGLKTWLATNSQVVSKFPSGSGQSPNIFYVADLRDQAPWELAAVRLVNASIIPTNATPTGAPTGWTLATPNPLYIQGNYNLGPGALPGTTNASRAFPSSLISDALTILSTSWNDATYTNASPSSREAGNTTINAALLTGIVYSNPTNWADTDHFSGGLMNLPRLLENWTGDTLTLNSAIVNVYDSIRATNQFRNPGIYYLAPTRIFNFDTNFLDPAKLPPGTPISGSPPVITSQPQNQQVIAGDTTALTLSITSDDPSVTYQWIFNGTNLPGETNASLTLTNVQPDQDGEYAAQIGSAFGLTISSNATVTVLSPSSYAATLSSFTFSPDGWPQFSVSGISGLNYAIWASTNLLDWESLTTNTSPFTFSDTNAALFPQRFYRAVYQP